MLVNKKRSKLFRIAIGLSVVVMAIFLFVNSALALDVWGGNQPGGGSSNFTNASSLGNANLRVVIANGIKLLIGFLGIIAVVIIIYGGWIWMTSGGDPQKIDKAKQILRNATIGLVLVIFSYAIASFILNWLIGAGQPGNQGGAPPPEMRGIGALGDSIIVSHYPARGQRDVPRNTSIIVTFRENMMANTICNTNGGRCQGEPIINNNVRIYKLAERIACTDNPFVPANCPSLTGFNVWSDINNRTFVFSTSTYIGSPTEYIYYGVYLHTDIQKANSDPAFGALGTGYEWSFEVSDKIDLTPPQVVRGNIFPAPDNAVDTENASLPLPAEWATIVNSAPNVERTAAVVSVNPQGASPQAQVQVDPACQRDEELNINLVGSTPVLFSGNNSLGQGSLNGRTITHPECGLTLTAAGDIAAGNSWYFTVTPAVQADTLTVGSTVYTFVSGPAGSNQIEVPGPWNVLTMYSNIRTKLNAGGEVVATSLTNYRAVVSGAAGNNIEFRTTNPAAYGIQKTQDGSNRTVTPVIQGGAADKPMNSTIQINFNEAIMPLTVSGLSTEVADYIRVVNNAGNARAGQACNYHRNCLSFECTVDDGSNGTCVNNELKGKFVVANQYTTVSFVSGVQCGINACGEAIYCLPASSNIRVELIAAGLAATCNGANDCVTRAPFTYCNAGYCQDGSGDNYPLSIMPPDGIADVALNSLDGNRDDDADGPVNFYNQNLPNAANGDNFSWRFFINDQLDLTSPVILNTTPGYPGPNDVPLSEKVLIHFNKPMLAESLTSGSVIIDNGNDQVVHQRVNLRPALLTPFAYWVTFAGLDTNNNGEIEETNVFINHSDYNPSTTYTAQAGSGVKDIYQNCYLPATGPACLNDPPTDTEPSCCNGFSEGVCQ